MLTGRYPLDRNEPPMTHDLDTMEAIDAMVKRFYALVLADPLLRPIFVDVARIDLDAHLPRITAYWGKLLLGQGDYRRNMVAQHQAIHAHCALQSRHFERWHELFRNTLEAGFDGPFTQRAGRLAATIVANLQRCLCLSGRAATTCTHSSDGIVDPLSVARRLANDAADHRLPGLE